MDISFLIFGGPVLSQFKATGS